MPGRVRSEISKRNQYYISKNRYFELKYFCLQYHEYKRIYNQMCEIFPGGIFDKTFQGGLHDDELMWIRQRYLDYMNLIEDCCKLTDPVLGDYIFKGVTEGYPYSYFKTTENIPCCKDTYYELYRKFFFILSRRKQRVL